MHPFEKAELGKAPFKFVGCDYRVGPIMLADGMTQIGAPGQPMGTCDYCGTGIANCMTIKSADGKRFVVGSDCVEKLYRDSNQTTTEAERAMARDPVYQAIRKARLEAERKARHQREARRIKEGFALLDAHQSDLEAIPNKQRPGESQWDRYQWFKAHAGNTGKLKIIKELKPLCQ